MDISDIGLIAGLVFADEPQRPKKQEVSWWKKEAEAAAAKIIPKRMERYWEHLLGRLEQEKASPVLMAAVPEAVKFTWSLLTMKASVRAERWRRLVKVAGVERAEWLVTELMVNTDMFAHSQLGPAIGVWAETAYSTKLYPPCMKRE